MKCSRQKEQPSSEPAADSSQSEALHRRVSAIAGHPRRKKLTSILARRCPRCTDPLALLMVVHTILHASSLFRPRPALTASAFCFLSYLLELSEVGSWRVARYSFISSTDAETRFENYCCECMPTSKIFYSERH